jgi:hypothetical protein
VTSYKQELIEVLAELRRIEDKIETGRLSPEEQAFVRSLIEESKFRKEFWRKMLERVAAGTLWSLWVAVFMGLLFALKEFIVRG